MNNFIFQFVGDGVFKAELNEFLTRELSEDGYSGVEVRVTPHRTEIILLATHTQSVLGEKGRRIRELTSVVQKRFNFKETQNIELYAEKVATRGLCAIAQAESLRFKLIGGLAVRRYKSYYYFVNFVNFVYYFCIIAELVMEYFVLLWNQEQKVVKWLLVVNYVDKEQNQ